MLISVEEMKQHLRIDGDEDNSYITDLIETSEAIIFRQTGKRFTQNKLARQCTRTLVTDMYENRGTDGSSEHSKTAQMILIGLCYEVDGS